MFNRYACFLFRDNQAILGWTIAKSIFDLENSRSRAWPSSSPNDHIWGLELNRYVCFLFRGNRAFFDWDIASSIFYLENSRSRSRRKSQSHRQGQCQWSHLRPGVQSWENRPKSNQVIYRSGLSIQPKIKEIRKVSWKSSREQKSQAGGGGGGYARTSAKTWSPHGIRGDLLQGWTQTRHSLTARKWNIYNQSLHDDN